MLYRGHSLQLSWWYRISPNLFNTHKRYEKPITSQHNTNTSQCKGASQYIICTVIAHAVYLQHAEGIKQHKTDKDNVEKHRGWLHIRTVQRGGVRGNTALRTSRGLKENTSSNDHSEKKTPWHKMTQLNKSCPTDRS